MFPLRNELLYWINERHQIYLKKEMGLPKPWTEDYILQSYRFCNICREWDKVTVWIRHNWREPYQYDPDLWFAMALARLVNWPETLAKLGYPKKWRPEHFLKTMSWLMGAGLKTFTGAYMVSTNGKGMDKPSYLADLVLTPLWEDRAQVRPRPGDTLSAFHARLMRHAGMGSFMAAQVVADVKYAAPLVNALDWWDWAASGPGSRRGLNRICGYPVNQRWNEQIWRFGLTTLHADIAADLNKMGIPRMHAQDLQNCLCETDKYLRTKNGEGRPRSRYLGWEV